jgi:hypothetical protein
MTPHQTNRIETRMTILSFGFGVRTAFPRDVACGAVFALKAVGVSFSLL